MARGGDQKGIKESDQQAYQPAKDDGSFMRDAVKGIAQYGACPEDDCKFPDFNAIKADIATLALDSAQASREQRRRKDSIVNAKPTDIAFKHAALHKIAKYWRLDADRPDAKVYLCYPRSVARMLALSY